MNSIVHHRREIFLLSLAVLGLAGVAVILTATRLGAGLSDDSFAYIKPARDLIAGQGFTLDPAFPPLLPILLIGFGFLKVDPLVSIRLVNALSFGLAVILSGWLVYKVSGSYLFGLFGALIGLTSEILIDVFSWALSEPLYFVLFLSSMAGLEIYFSKQNMRWLILSAILAGLAAITRYAGITLIGAGVIVLLLTNRRSWSSRFYRVVIFAAIAVLPISLYVVRNIIFYAKPIGSRNFIWQFPSISRIQGTIEGILTWFIPGRFVHGKALLVGGLLVGVGLAALLVFLLTHRPTGLRIIGESIRMPMPLLWILFIVLNFALLTAGTGTFGRGDPFNSRYLSPCLLVTLMALSCILAKLWSDRLRGFQAAAIIVCLLIAGVYTYRSVDWVRYLSVEGQGFASSRWHISETVAYIRNRPDVPFVCTGNVGVYFWTGTLYPSISSFPSPVEMRNYLRTNHGLLVIIDSMPPDLYNVDEQQLFQGMVLKERFSEGSVYEVQP
ncbi:MAG TPA: glycosyltransferase family 39 protein [Anaerolineaceae bacterium]|nr:glycosyltransferase family 39 protein [Anaerolineaceae bacterium]